MHIIMKIDIGIDAQSRGGNCTHSLNQEAGSLPTALMAYMLLLLLTQNYIQ